MHSLFSVAPKRQTCNKVTVSALMSKDDFGDGRGDTQLLPLPPPPLTKSKKKSHPDRGLHIPVIPSLGWLKLKGRMVSSRPA